MLIFGEWTGINRRTGNHNIDITKADGWKEGEKTTHRPLCRDPLFQHLPINRSLTALKMLHPGLECECISNNIYSILKSEEGLHVPIYTPYAQTIRRAQGTPAAVITNPSSNKFKVIKCQRYYGQYKKNARNHFYYHVMQLQTLETQFLFSRFLSAPPACALFSFFHYHFPPFHSEGRKFR